jgi:hypothetical protein
MIANPRRDCCAQFGTATTIAVSESVAREVARHGVGGGGGGNARARKIMCGMVWVLLLMSDIKSEVKVLGAACVPKSRVKLVVPSQFRCG